MKTSSDTGVHLTHFLRKLHTTFFSLELHSYPYENKKVAHDENVHYHSPSLLQYKKNTNSTIEIETGAK